MRKPWKLMTDEEKNRQREYCRKYRQTEKGKKKTLARKRRWNTKNRLRKREIDREVYERKKTDEEWKRRKNESNRRWVDRHANDDGFKADRYARSIEWRDNNRARYNEIMRKARKSFNERHPGYAKACDSKYATRRRLLFARDASAYATYREKQRERARLRAEKDGRIYRQRISMRIPDYCTFGQSNAFHSRSVFIRNNHEIEHLREFDGYARELFIERKNKRKGVIA